MKKGEDAIAYTRKQFRDSIEIQIYIWVCVVHRILVWWFIFEIHDEEAIDFIKYDIMYFKDKS